MYHLLKLCKPNTAIKSLALLIISLLFSSFFSIELKCAEELSTPINYSQDITHFHTGSKSRGGGCYKKPVTETITYENRCKGTMIYFAEWNTTQCNICGASYTGDESGRECYTINPTTYTTTTYKLSCGFKDNDVIGTFSVTPDTSEWTKEVTLTLDLSPESLSEADNPFSINDSNITGNTFTVTDNCSLTASVDVVVNSYVDPVTLTISNIDNTAPSVSIEYDQTPDIASTQINVSAIDLQPDQTPGCGLPDSPYSFDGGKSWTPSPSFTVTQNGDYSVMVRDTLGNIVTNELVIDNIKIPDPPKNDEKPSSEEPKEENKPSPTQNTPSNPGNSTPAITNDYTPSNDVTPQNPVDITPQTNIIPVKNVQVKKETPNIDSDDDEAKVPVDVTPFPLPKPLKKEKEVKISTSELKSNAEVKKPTVLETKEESAFTDMVPLILGILAGLLALLGLIFFLCRLAAISNYKSKTEYTLKCFSFIHSKDGVFYINLSQNVIDRCSTNLLSITPSAVFRFLHKGDELTVYSPDKQAYPVIIDDEMKVSLKGL